MTVLLTRYNTGEPFVTQEGSQYFLYGALYQGDEELLLNSIKNIKPGNFHQSCYSDKKDKDGHPMRHQTLEEFWQAYMNYQYTYISSVIDARPYVLWENELCRQGRLKCDDCGETMYMFRWPRCPNCDVPKPDERKRIDLILLCKYIDHKHKLEDSFRTIINNQYDPSKDRVIDFSRGDINDQTEYGKILGLIDDLYKLNEYNFWIS